MSLKHLSTGKSAQFFRPNPRRRISKTAAAGIGKKVSIGRSGRIQEKKIREPITIDGDAVYITYVCFPIESQPAFTSAEIKQVFSTVLSDPNTERSVVLVLSGISLKQRTKEFAALKAGTARPPVSHFGFWLSLSRPVVSTASGRM